MLGRIALELKLHAPFTAFGALTGIVIMVAMLYSDLPPWTSEGLSWTAHPLHVLLSAMATTARGQALPDRSYCSEFLTANTGQGALRSTRSVVEPMIA